MSNPRQQLHIKFKDILVEALNKMMKASLETPNISFADVMIETKEAGDNFQKSIDNSLEKVFEHLDNGTIDNPINNLD